LSHFDEIVYQPHPLYPPLLKRRGGRIGFEGAKLLWEGGRGEAGVSKKSLLMEVDKCSD